MPSVDVAPIYSDPWTQSHYEGMARLIEAVPDTADKTLNDITCRYYCVRFFYTSVNRRRWVEVSAITTWEDSLDRYASLTPASDMTKHVQSNTAVALISVAMPGATHAFYIGVPALAVDQVILGYGFESRIHTALNVASYVMVDLYDNSADDPVVGPVSLATGTEQNQSDTYIPFYKELAAPHTILAGEGFSFRLVLHAVSGPGPAKSVYLRAPFVRLERTI